MRPPGGRNRAIPQTLPPLNVGGQAHRRWRSLQELVVESLVVSLAMAVVDVLAHEET